MIPPEDVLDVRQPPGQATGKVAELWKPIEGSNKVMCTACARYCKIGEGQVGLCGIRGVHQGKLWLYVYGRVITGHVDPIEKKPVQHYRPGSKIFSIATTGCNWLCHPAGTKILMTDGSTKPVEEVSRGDILWSISQSRNPWPSVVTSHGSRRAPSYRVRFQETNDALLATAEHPILTSSGWRPVSRLSPGELVLAMMGESSEADWFAPPAILPAHGRVFHPKEMITFGSVLQTLSGRAPRFKWRRVEGIKEEDTNEPVFSFECVPFHNYVADGAVVHNCRYCFAPGTLILTENGHVPIESLFQEGSATDNPETRDLGDHEVLTHRGRWRQVRHAFQHLYEGTLLAIRPFYLPGFRCTPDHQVFASVAGGPVRKVRAHDLKVGDFLAVPRPSPEANHPLDMDSFVRSHRSPDYKYSYKLEARGGRIRWTSEKGPGIPAQIRVTPDFARLVGYYCAEGSVSWHRKRPNSGSVWFSLGHEETERITEVRRLVEKTLGLPTRAVVQNHRAAVIVPSATVARLFRESCGDSCENKRVPSYILRSTDPAVVLGFLTGYLNGDGYVTKGKGTSWVLGSSSVSPALTYGVAHLLVTLGETPRVYVAQNDSQYEIEGRKVSRSDDYMLRLFVDQVRMDPDAVEWVSSKVRTIRTAKYLLIPIREISEEHYVGPVYNIEVEEDHSYTANGLAVGNCQNADISQRRKVEGIEVAPEDVVRMTLEQGCQGLAYTYNQPTIFIEFARDIGVLARKAGLINIFVSNGYDTPETVREMEKFLDCVTVDFKGSGETEFVRKYINIPNADPIYQTILEMRDTKKIHIEITDLIVPQVGDSLDAARKLARWVNDNLGPDTPIHFLRFHPDYKMMEFPWTPVETLEKHCAVAKEEGLRYVYIGNVPGHRLENTYCPGCGAMAVKRYGFDITGWYLDKDNKCKKCGTQVAIVGRLEKTSKENRFYGVLYPR